MPIGPMMGLPVASAAPEVVPQDALPPEQQDEFSALMARLTPEQLAQYIALGTLDERGGLAQQQAARAQALRNYEAPQMSTPGGAIGAGLGDLFREVGGGIGGMRAQGQLEDLLNQKDAGRLNYVRAMAQYLRGTPDDSLQKEKVVDLSGMTGY